jgi:CheY-like chemotaxis protein
MQPIRILIADDNTIMRKVLRANLDKLDIEKEIFYAADGRQAIQSLLHHKFNIIFLDLNMPHFTGFDISNYINAKHFDVEIIVISSELSSENVEIFKSLGVKYFLEKPFNIKNFNDTAVPIIKKLAESK